MEGVDIGNVAVAGSGWAALVLKELYNRFVSTEGKANDQLVEQLSKRIEAQEERMKNLEAGLDEERRLRRLAEDRVHVLELDNLQLKMELKRHGFSTELGRTGS